MNFLLQLISINRFDKFLFKRNLIFFFFIKLKQVTTQLSNVFTGSSVLQSTITNLIDFELLINPLNAIYNSIYQITALGTMEHINQKQIQQTKANLAQIILILPNLPFNLNTNLIC